jgi:hypothetical protein
VPHRGHRLGVSEPLCIRPALALARRHPVSHYDPALSARAAAGGRDLLRGLADPRLVRLRVRVYKERTGPGAVRGAVLGQRLDIRPPVRSLRKPDYPEWRVLDSAHANIHHFNLLVQRRLL